MYVYLLSNRTMDNDNNGQQQEHDMAMAGLSPPLTRYGTPPTHLCLTIPTPPYGLIPPHVIPRYLLVNVLDTVN